MPDEYGNLTPEELAKERLRLYQMGVGLAGLRQGMPHPEGVDLPQPDTAVEWSSIGIPGMTPEQAALDKEIARRQRELNARAGAINTAERAAGLAGRTRAAQSQVASAIGEPSSRQPLTAEQALIEGGQSPVTSTAPTASTDPGAFVGPKQMTKEVITAVRQPDGRIVFTNATVPINDTAAEKAYGEGVGDWRSKALAENDIRARTQGGLNASGQVSQNFLVGNTPGYGASRQLPALSASFEDVQQESPLIQDKWMAKKLQDLGLSTQEAELGGLGSRNRLMNAQAGLAEEQLRRQQNPEIAAREVLAPYNVTRQVLGEERAAKIEDDFHTAVRALQALGKYDPADDIAIRQRIIEANTGDAAIAQRLAIAMGGNVAVQAARARGYSY